jgi:multisubunit Na+/H+ antiporter MnhB subunit
MNADLAYYAVSAQVITTALIAVVLALRQRTTRHGWANNWPNAIALASPLIAAVVGTAAAVIVVNTGRPTELADTLVAVGYGGVAGGLPRHHHRLRSTSE